MVGLIRGVPGTSSARGNAEREREMVLMHRGCARVLQRREFLAAVHHGGRMDQQIAIRPLLSSQALPAFWQSTSATGLVCRKEDRSGRDGPDDRAEGAGKGAGRRGHPQRLLEYRLALVRSLTRSAWKANLTFEVGAEELNGIADRSVWRFVSMPSSIC